MTKLGTKPNDALEQFALGYHYETGTTVPQDHQKAVQYYRKAAEQGFDEAQFRLGCCYEDGQGVAQNHQQAALWYRKAAVQGLAAAQFSLGCCYEGGHGVPQDYQQAALWYLEAARQGFAAAQFSLGCCYEDGQGVAQDYQEAALWYHKAARQGDVDAQYSLGCCYKYGQGVTRDYQQTVYWFRKAAEQGDEEAQEELRTLRSNWFKPSTPPQGEPERPAPSTAQEEPHSSWTKPPTPSKIYAYIRSLPKNEVAHSIEDEYYHIKGSFHMAPAMGIFGSFEFASVLLIWKYLRKQLKSDLYTIGEFMIPLGAHIGCAYNGMSAVEWSDILESIIKAHKLLPYDEFSRIYIYLKENFSNEIHGMEFNNGGKGMDIMKQMTAYYYFQGIYNAFPDYSSTLSYYERQGLRIKQDMPFKINC